MLAVALRGTHSRPAADEAECLPVRDGASGMSADGLGAGRVHGVVVERDMIVGLGVVEDLLDLGFRVSGPFMNAREVIDLLASDPPDFAIVDVGLRDGSGRSAAQALRARGIPLVIFTAGDRRAYLDGEFEDVPWVEKPAATDRLLGVLADLRSGRARQASRAGPNSVS